MTMLRVLLVMLRLMPSRGEADVAYRTELAVAIVSVTDDVLEQDLLASIARWEGAYRRDVGECRRPGPQGELGAWQVLARSDVERARLCASLEGDARLALERVRESITACAHLPPAERLAVYARGRCDSAEGRKLSRHRWFDTRGGAR